MDRWVGGGWGWLDRCVGCVSGGWGGWIGVGGEVGESLTVTVQYKKCNILKNMRSRSVRLFRATAKCNLAVFGTL